MAKRFTDTELWDKEWFMKLSPKLKCLVKMVRDKCDLSGVWSPNWIIANTYIGESVSESELISIDDGNQFEKLPSGKILCIDFISFQYGKLSENSPVHRKIISILNTHKIEYQYPINRVQEEEEDKEEEKEKVKDKEIPNQIEFLNYCKEILKEKYQPLEFSLKAKYEAWLENKWKDGNGSKIKNWKTKIKNTIPFLKPEYKAPNQTDSFYKPLPKKDYEAEAQRLLALTKK